jgi:hypothetical protein
MLGIFVPLALVVGAIFFFFNNFYFSALPDPFDAPSNRVISVNIPPENHAPDDIQFVLRAAVDLGSFAQNHSETVCISIQGEITTGRAARLTFELGSNSRILVDDRILLWLPFRQVMNTLNSRYDMCFNVSNLPVGLHTIPLNTSTASGIPYSQTWQIRIED